MEDQKQQLIQRLKEAKNVLVTVSRDPSVDQLAAAIGLTIAFNRLDKHATAVYSGTTPSTLEFLRPEETLEKTTDSLRDFIIALDKSKADKLRYKVEDQVVRIFITPYHTAISESDLDFSQGDFNVDVVVALGVKTQQDIDEAVQAHGRILHDATVAVLSTEGQPELGTLNVVNTEASSLSEMALELVEGLSNKVLDTQIATALLTGIVAMTDRFSNDRTTPKTMSASATLMAAGANQQLITSELEAPVVEPEEALADDQDENQGGDVPSEDADEPDAPQREPGTLEIEHEEAVLDDEPAELPAIDSEPDSDNPQIHVDENGRLSTLDEPNPTSTEFAPFLEQPEPPRVEIKRERMTTEPSFDNPLSANTEEEHESPATEQLTQPASVTPILSHNEHVLSADPSFVPPELPEDTSHEADLAAAPDMPIENAPLGQGEKTLAEIEQEVNSPHLHADEPAPDFVDSARAAVDAARQASTPEYIPAPISALNAQPLGDALHEENNVDVSSDTDTMAPAADTSIFTMPPISSAPSAFPGAPLPATDQNGEQPKAPPVPPPMY